MITQEQVTAMVGCTAYTEQGQRVGGVDYVLVDDTTGRPEWARITDRASGLGGVFVPLRNAALEDQRLVLPYAVSLIERAPCAALDCGSVLSVTEEQQLFAHYGIRDVREEVNAESGAGWGQMDRAGAIREGTAGQEVHLSRLRPAQPGR
ncbi:PRC-barrel domain-containing protein [Streptomyces sp. ISL-66]|uniref:PRC-barrel domain-containing protein n=1 Tax=Streptomyces sp. ISL-66 TaxID=2819186 RepID=UPI001BE93A34|nr:PRC-barrel domain-containing protein [Streptomyces sp. ISL-66]MBT2468997.1 PRC-barrel domain-containing protein [Streptomyces sp. ISL-66]